MIIYEVKATVTEKIFNDYVSWLKSEHIKEVCACQGFSGAEILIGRQDDPNGTKTVCALYKIDTKQNLDLYLKEKAPALREKGADRWGNQFSVTRTTWLESCIVN